ncbi:MAG: hypothetical protein HETSPECPRED_010516, partial [Heterodermia speciosa]
LVLLFFTRPRASWTQNHQYQSPHTNESLPTNNSQGRIEAQYHDDESSTEDIVTGTEGHSRAITTGDSHPEGPAVQPSGLHREDERERNEWA